MQNFFPNELKKLHQNIVINQANNIFPLSVAQATQTNWTFFDFYNDAVKCDIEVKLSQYAQVCLNIIIGAKQTQNKIYRVKIFTQAEQTSCLVNTFCIASEEGSVEFHLQNQISCGGTKAIVEQNIQGFLLSNQAKIIAEPALIIQDSVDKTTHSLQIGFVNPQHLFYLMRCGLSQNQANYLLVLSQIKKATNILDSLVGEYAKLLSEWF